MSKSLKQSVSNTRVSWKPFNGSKRGAGCARAAPRAIPLRNSSPDGYTLSRLVFHEEVYPSAGVICGGPRQVGGGVTGDESRVGPPSTPSADRGRGGGGGGALPLGIPRHARTPGNVGPPLAAGRVRAARAVGDDRRRAAYSCSRCTTTRVPDYTRRARASAGHLASQDEPYPGRFRYAGISEILLEILLGTHPRECACARWWIGCPRVSPG